MTFGPIMLASSRRDFDVVFRSYTTSGLTGLSIGPADPDRYIIFACGSGGRSVGSSSVICPITAMSINGIACTELAHGASGLSDAQIWMAPVPLLTTASLSVSRTNPTTNLGFGISLYSAIGPIAPSALAVASTGGPGTVGVTLAAAKDGYVIAAATCFNVPAPTFTWGAPFAPPDVSTSIEASDSYTTSLKKFAAAGTTSAIVTPSGGASATPPVALAAASFGYP